MPYFTRKGKHWRSKRFSPSGEQRWLGGSKPLIPYGLESLGHDMLLLTEGESDALALRLAFPTVSVLGIPGALSWRNEWLTCLDDARAIYLSFDADAAGKRLASTVLDAIPFARKIALPEGADTRDVLQQLGRDAYKVLVEEARQNYAVKQAWRELDRVVAKRRAVDDAWQEKRPA